MDITQMKAVLEQSAKTTKTPKKAVIKAVALMGEELKQKETAIIKAVGKIKSGGVAYMLQNALDTASNWAIIDIAYKGKEFKDKEGNTKISQTEGLVFQNVAKSFVKKVCIE